MNPDQNFYEAVERISQAYPYEEVRLEVLRNPGGVYRYVSTLASNEDLGLPFEYASGATIEECVESILTYTDKRNPEKCLQAKIREHEQKIAKLRVALMNLALPPWKPIAQLGVGNPASASPPEAPKFINVESELVPPF